MFFSLPYFFLMNCIVCVRVCERYKHFRPLVTVFCLCKWHYPLVATFSFSWTVVSLIWKYIGLNILNLKSNRHSRLYLTYYLHDFLSLLDRQFWSSFRFRFLCISYCFLCFWYFSLTVTLYSPYSSLCLTTIYNNFELLSYNFVLYDVLLKYDLQLFLSLNIENYWFCPENPYNDDCTFLPVATLNCGGSSLLFLL